MNIGNKQLMELFGTETNKETYARTKKIPPVTKDSLLSRAINEYKVVEDLGRGRYIIDEKYDGTIIIPNNKMAHPIYGNLIPSILINVKNYHESGNVFCLSLNAIYSNFQMINKHNYSKMYSRRKTSSEILNIHFDTLNEFFEVTHDSLKYYLDKSLAFLENLGLVKVIKIPYISLIEAETVHFEKDVVNSEVKQQHRRATKEEYQLILDYEEEVRLQFNIKKEKSKLFGEPLKALKEKLKNHNIDYYYECYEILSSKSKEITEIVDFYGKENLKQLSEDFSNNFISMTIANAESRHNDAITLNLKDYYRFSKDYLNDFMTLSNITLDKTHESVYIPKYKVESSEDYKGELTVDIKKLD